MIYQIQVYAQDDRKRVDPNRDGANTTRDTGYLYGDIVQIFRQGHAPNANSTRKCIILEVDTHFDDINIYRESEATPYLREDGTPGLKVVRKRLRFLNLDEVMKSATREAVRAYRCWSVSESVFQENEHLTTEVNRR